MSTSSVQDYEDLIAGRFAAVRVHEPFAPLHYRGQRRADRLVREPRRTRVLAADPGGPAEAFARDVADVPRRYTGADGIDPILPALVVLADK